MAFNPQEQEIIKAGKLAGKSKEEVLNALARYRSGYQPPEPVAPQPTLLDKAKSLGIGAAKGTIGGTIDTTRLLRDVGAGAMSIIPGAKEKLDKSAEAFSLKGKGAEGIDATLKAQNPEEMAGKVAGFGIDVLASGGAGLLKRGASFAGRKLAEAGSEVAGAVGSSPTLKAAGQTVSDIADRVPRFFGRVKEGIEQSAQRSEKIRTATPEVAQALKVELPEKYINTIQASDAPTNQAFKRVLDIADESPKTITGKKNPTIVGGELASKQYETIEAQRKAIGSQIGEAVDKLTQSNVRANMGVALRQVDDVLAENGITIGDKGKLQFVGKYTNQERTRIQELYDLANEGGEVLTARQVKDFDQLFSKLQRESRMEGTGNLMVNANGQDISLFRLFRDVYSNQLDNIAPEIRDLNRAYRNIATLIDDIEDSIIKTPNFNITKSTDPAEFAKVNLRRIFGESQSSPVYEAIADEMDTVARQLGYADAKPKDVAEFAQVVRELYPETIPKTGFQGGIKGVMDVVGQAMDIGATNVEDKRKALRALIEATLKAN